MELYWISLSEDFKLRDAYFEGVRLLHHLTTNLIGLDFYYFWFVEGKIPKDCQGPSEIAKMAQRLLKISDKYSYTSDDFRM